MFVALLITPETIITIVIHIILLTVITGITGITRKEREGQDAIEGIAGRFSKSKSQTKQYAGRAKRNKVQHGKCSIQTLPDRILMMARMLETSILE
jgi:hypothetical protein